MRLSESYLVAPAQAFAPPRHPWIYRRAVLPVLAFLRMGASPDKLAWSIAAGLLIGINPILGSTTVLCLAAAFLLRLNIAASQFGSHIVYPLQLLLILPFLHIAARVFHTARLPFSATELLHAVREHPLELSRLLWQWEWHAFLLWTALTIVAVPCLALVLKPVLRRLLVQAQHPPVPMPFPSAQHP